MSYHTYTIVGSVQQKRGAGSARNFTRFPFCFFTCLFHYSNVSVFLFNSCFILFFCFGPFLHLFRYLYSQLLYNNLFMLTLSNKSQVFFTQALLVLCLTSPNIWLRLILNLVKTVSVLMPLLESTTCIKRISSM